MTSLYRNPRALCITAERTHGAVKSPDYPTCISVSDQYRGATGYDYLPCKKYSDILIQGIDPGRDNIEFTKA